MDYSTSILHQFWLIWDFFIFVFFLIWTRFGTLGPLGQGPGSGSRLQGPLGQGPGSRAHGEARDPLGLGPPDAAAERIFGIWPGPPPGWAEISSRS